MTNEDTTSPTPTPGPAEQAMADTAARRGRRGALTAAERAPRPVRRVDPIALATALRSEFMKAEPARRTEMFNRVRTVLLDADSLRLLLAINELPGTVAADDLTAASALASHGL